MRDCAKSVTGPHGLSMPPSMHDDLPPAPRVFVVDDNVGLRSSLRDLLADAGIEIVGEAGDGAEAIRCIPSVADARPVVALMDVRMPGPINGIEATRVLIDRCEDVAVIVFTAFPGTGIEQAARAAGAAGLLTKGCPAETLIDAILRTWSRMVPVAP
jgi:two-component system invasion response regulator UvrY